jgi:hypothetical protein
MILFGDPLTIEVGSLSGKKLEKEANLVAYITSVDTVGKLLEAI